MVDPATLGRNTYVLIGGLILLGVGFFLLVAAWTMLKVWLWRARQRRSLRAWLEATRRADGGMYPPHAEGVCQECRRGDRRIHHLPGGEQLCPACYERYRPRVEANPGREPAIAQPD